QPVSPVQAASLLIGGEREHDRTLRRYAGALTCAYDRQHHRVEVLHVDGSASVEIAVDDVGRDRVMAPVARLRGYDVEVAVNQQWRFAAGVIAPACDETRPARRRLVDL